MTALITVITSLVTAAAGWVNTFVGTMTAEGNEIILLFALLPIVGLGIGVMKRLMRA